MKIILTGCCIGAALLLAAAAVYFRKTEKALPARVAVTGLLVLGLLAVWGVGMYCLTSVTAEYAAARYRTGYGDFADIIANGSFVNWYGKGLDAKYANYDANCRWEAADNGGHAGNYAMGSLVVGGSGGFLSRVPGSQVYSAAAVCDAQGNLLECSWWDFFYFEYLTETQWLDREERSGNKARAFFDPALLTDRGLEIIGDGYMSMEAAALRFTGTFDGLEFTPARIEYVDWKEYWDALFSKGSGRYTVSGVVQDYGLAWNTIYENPAVGGETVTLYSDWFDVCYDQTSPPFSYQGAEYENLAALVSQLGPELAVRSKNMASYEGADLLLPSVSYCLSHDGEIYYDSHYGGADGYGDQPPQLLFYTVSAVYCSPWRTALRELRYVYLNSLVLLAALALVLQGLIHRHLIRPVQTVGRALVRDEGDTLEDLDLSEAWQESRLLQEGLARCRDRVRMQKNEVIRLNTALEYAKTAEQNRRQMTSHIAHELKTPLAVIHSYAEGLKEHIAEEKRDKYVDVILSEVRRTDAMVLEMLDLSRLEAGKVKLSRDRFSLAALTRSVFEKLEMAVRAKELQIGFDFPEDCTVTADEARMAQVIENFATNAVKYTPAGGHVQVRIKPSGAGTLFSVENDSAPLSEEARRKVWDTFYRTDEARSGGGTGLGLAIARNIVELHGGKCAVRNTKTGVEFSFWLQ